MIGLLIVVLELIWLGDGLKAVLLSTGKRSSNLVNKHGTSRDQFAKLLQIDNITEIPMSRLEESDFPTIEQINQYDLMIIPGAAKVVEWEDPWMLHVEQLIRDPQRRPWVFGVCFGHQLACKAFGGAVEINEKGWEVGVQEISIVDSKISDIIDINRLNVLQSHKRHVLKVPNGLTVWASNEHSVVQGVWSKNLKLFTCQFHPEYTKSYFLDTCDARPISDEQIEQVKGVHLKPELIKRILRKFLQQ